MFAGVSGPQPSQQGLCLMQFSFICNLTWLVAQARPASCRNCIFTHGNVRSVAMLNYALNLVSFKV